MRTPPTLMAAALGLGLLFATTVSVAAAQQPADTLSGLVFDEASGTPVPGAAVLLVGSEGGEPLASTTADDRGSFRLPVTRGRYWLVASRDGFASSAPVEVILEEGSEVPENLLLNLRDLDAPALAVAARREGEGEGGRILGRVLDHGTGNPVSGAAVTLASSGLQTLTDAQGMFVFPDVPAGLEELALTHLAYGTQTSTVLVEPGMSYRVDGRLRAEAIELEGIEVSVTSRSWFRRMDGLRFRMQSGLGGSYVLADELEQRGYPRLPDVLRTVPGVRVERNRFDWNVTVSRCGSGANGGQPVVYLDGVKVHKPGSGPMLIMQELATLDVEAIEVYKGAASVPGEFGGSDAACGAIVIWSRRGGG